MRNLKASYGLLLSTAAVLCLTAAVAVPSARAQTGTNAELEELAAIRAASNSVDHRPPHFNFLRGFNTSLTTAFQHNSNSGWTTVFYPNLAWRLNQHFGADVSVPAYGFLNIYTNIGTTAKPFYGFQAQRGGAWGDTVINFEGDTLLRSYGYSGVFSLGLPTGHTNYGIGANQVTYSINNWFQRDIGRFTPNVALGYGNTSSLINQGVLRNYIAVGPMAHFQAGTSVALTRSISFNAAAYEELPLDTDLIYSTTTQGKKKIITTTNEDPGEDNGFLTSLGVPVSSHVTLAGFYSRSLRDHTDLVGISFTILARSVRPQQ